MTFIALILLSVILVEVFMWAKLLPVARRLMEITQRSVHVISSSKISDRRKEKVLLIYSRIIFACTFNLFLCLSAVVAAAALYIVALDYAFSLSPGLWEITTSAKGLVITTLAALMYWKVRPHRRVVD